MQCVVTVCARAGSKGLPGKALKRLGGKSLLEHSIDHGREYRKRNGGDVVVSTDVSVSFYPDVALLGRPANLATDTSPKVEVIRWIANMFPYTELIIDLDICNPMRSVKDIETMVEFFEYNKPLTMVSVCHARKNPHFNMVTVCNGQARVVVPGDYSRRQDAPAVYELNNSIFLYDAEALRDGRIQSSITSDTSVYIMPECTRNDVDSEFDFQQLEAAWGLYGQKF